MQDMKQLDEVFDNDEVKEILDNWTNEIKQLSTIIATLKGASKIDKKAHLSTCVLQMLSNYNAIKYATTELSTFTGIFTANVDSGVKRVMKLMKEAKKQEKEKF